ncbi:phosphoethanolamine transferase [Acinetobacter proteolyticus]|uniref:phosphoethanolamine transferase n=1 Tax=Acinetobacter proteolyticus TaxID=1776741 RepID=UPI003D989FE6
MLDEQVLAIVLETNIQEAKSFVGSYIFILIGWVFLSVFILILSIKKTIVWSHYSRWLVFILFTGYFFVQIVFSNNLAEKIDKNFNDKNFLVEEKNNFMQDIKKTYPLGLVISLYDLFREQNKINDEFNKNRNFKFNSILKNINKQTIVLVIGESSRRENWQLNNYYRETNPYLISQKNLVDFKEMISISNATRSSIPIILTRKSAEKVQDYVFNEKSIISAFKEVGFSTYWISTQQQFGGFDTSTSVYAKEADRVIFLNKTSYTNKGDPDGILVPKFNEIVKTNSKKKFIVIHMLGSHYNYAHRYPKEYDRFRPSLNDLKKYNMQDKKYKTQLINSYDNSILYTDYVLNQFIDILKKEEDTESFLFFVSDHGEDLFDGECNKSGHGNRTIYNFDIASFAWYSDLFYKGNVLKVNELNKKGSARINQTTIFPSLIDAANIEIPNYSLQRSILRKNYEYPRYIIGGVNYDQAKYGKICKEIE